MSALAVVTGASAGIGRATAAALARAGLDVVAAGRSQTELETTASMEPGRIVAVPADVRTPAGRARIRDAVGERAVVALVHGAGVFPRGLVERLTAQEWQSAMTTNVEARLHLVIELRERLRGGRVLFIGSDAATTPRPGGAAYSVSMAASVMLWRCLGVELGAEIAFGIAKPGLVATRMMDESLRAPRDRFPAGSVYADMLARGQTIAPETVAAFFRWLLLETSAEEFAADIWDIRHEAHQPRWLEGALFRPPADRAR